MRKSALQVALNLLAIFVAEHAVRAIARRLSNPPPLVKGWRPRVVVRSQRSRAGVGRVWGVGARAGYWPCLKAPFVRLDVGPVIAEAWVGYPTYLVGDESRASL